MRRHLLGLSTALALAGGTVWAQDADELFGKLDANKDGYVTPDEVQDSQKSLYQRLVRTSDKNGDGRLSKEEFQAGLKPDEAPKTPLAGGQPPGRPGDGKADPRMFFDRLDANKDGKLSKDELPERMRENLARLDANSDGFVSPEEFGRAAPPFGKRPPGAPPAPQGRPTQVNLFDRDQLEALFDRTDSNSDGKLTKDEIPEERLGMRGILERAGGESLTKDQFVRGMLAMAQAVVQPPRPEGAPSRPEGARPENAPSRRPDGPPGGPPGGGLFAALDVDRNGEISTAEIVGAGTALLKLDRNGDGKLTPEEVFGPGGPPGAPPGRPGEGRPGEGRPGQRGVGGPGAEEFRQRMRSADTNGDGKISKEEAPPMLKERFDRVDTNGDGYIDQEEARRMFERGGNPPGKRPPGDKN